MLYLNKERVHDNFISNLGDIDSFTKMAQKIGKGTVKTPFIEFGGEIVGEAQVTWTINEPITQVLVLRAALESAGLVYRLDDIGLGRFISFVGRGFISRPGLFDAEHRARLANHPDVYDALEARRASIESTENLIRETEARQWLLTVSEGASVCAAVLDDQWLKPGFHHWTAPLTPEYRHEIFGLFRQFESGIPILATVYVGVKW
jgi:hypothetical protein